MIGRLFNFPIETRNFLRSTARRIEKFFVFHIYLCERTSEAHEIQTPKKHRMILESKIYVHCFWKTIIKVWYALLWIHLSIQKARIYGKFLQISFVG